MESRSNRYAGLKKSFKGKHLPGCKHEDAPLEFCDCICTQPEREVLLSDYVLDKLEEILAKEKQDAIKIRSGLSDQNKPK